MCLTALITICVAYIMYKSRWGRQVRAVVQNRVMAGAVGINTEKVDRYTFGLGCGIAGIAGSAFTMIGSTGPTAGQLYIFDTFLVVVFGGAASLLGTIASAFTISQTQSTLEFFLSGSMAKVITLLAIVAILMMRPQGLFALKVRKPRKRAAAMTNSRFANRSELLGILVLAVILVVILPLCLDVFRLNLVAKYLTYAFVALGLVVCWGYCGILSLGQGVFFGLGGYCMAMYLSSKPRASKTPRSSRRRASPTSWTGIRLRNCRCSGSRSIVSPSRYLRSYWCRRSSPSSSVLRCSSAGSVACTSRSLRRRSQPF
jgi:ABC-type branched-subunit amino acid transport system permease subunit